MRTAARRVLGSKKRKQAKVKLVMGEYKRGKLKSSSGQKVTKRSQGIAIALSEAKRYG
jgi:hypothetical protein